MAKFGDVFKGTDVKKTDNRPRSETRWLHYTKLIDNTDQYRKSATEEDIVAFAELIKSAGKVLQDLLVRKSGTDTYEIIAGHHRRLACKYLVEVEGLKEFEFLPCKVENVDDVQAEFQLYATNGFMPKTDAEKLHEIERIKYLLDTYPDQFKQVKGGGRTVEKIARILNMGKTTVGDYVTKINVHINSGGGSVFGGIAIYNILKRYDAEITVYVEGLAASIASVIAMAGDKIIIPENAQMMIHKPSSVTWGNADDMRKEADILDGCQKVILNTYMQHTKEGVTAEEIDSLINAETWKNGKEWQEFFDIEVSEKSQATACKSEYFDKYNHLPDKLKEQPQQQINIDDLAERVAEKLKDATQPEVPKIPENDVKQKTAEILEDLELI